MGLMDAITLALHCAVVYRGAMFFRQCKGRDNDRHIVATVMACSVLFVVTHVSFLLGRGSVAPIGVGFAAFNAVLYLRVIEGYLRVQCYRRGPA